MNSFQETVESTVSAVASKATGAGSAVSVVSWFASFDFGLWAGILIGFAGLVINWYFRRKSDKRAEESHLAFMTKLREDRGASAPRDECSA